MSEEDKYKKMFLTLLHVVVGGGLGLMFGILGTHYYDEQQKDLQMQEMLARVSAVVQEHCECK
jgi:arginine decarboxylase-like protein